MSTSVSVNTYAHSVTYVTDQLLNSLKRIIIWIGLDPANFVHSWESKERALSTWLKTKDLEKIVLEIFDPDTPDKLAGRWDFSVNYDAEDTDTASMWTDIEAVKFAIAKAGIIPSKCEYRVLLITKDGRPDVHGWSRTPLRSTAGFTKQHIGTTIGTTGISAAGGYWRQSS